MRGRLIRAVLLVSAPLLAHMARAEDPITVSINPEARVSVALTGDLPRMASCGTRISVPVTIINKAYLTARLEALLLEPTRGARIEFSAEPLVGVPLERRRLSLTMIRAGVTDITLQFRARNEMPDLGGRDRIHFLLRCLAAPTPPRGAS